MLRFLEDADTDNYTRLSSPSLRLHLTSSLSAIDGFVGHTSEKIMILQECVQKDSRWVKSRKIQTREIRRDLQKRKMLGRLKRCIFW